MTYPQIEIEIEPVYVPAGEFLMGSDPKKDKNAHENEQPQHRLFLPDYYIAKTPVTNTQYAAFVQAAGHRLPEHWKDKEAPQGKENHPVVYIHWRDAVAYCRWLAQATGKSYRLPTEAEWEKAARGTDGRIYPWGDEWDARRCNASEGGLGETTPVGAYPEGASPYGALDMVGNAWEWCSTIWEDNPYPFRVQDEWIATYLDRTDACRVLRGGVFYAAASWMRCAARPWPSRSKDRGFRVALE